MIGHRVNQMQMQCLPREYDCNVTFLKVSDISVPLQTSRSFKSNRPAGSPGARSEGLPKRFLKLTTLYGTGQQEIGEFQISGGQCEIDQRRSYKFVSTDSITKLHIYVDEVFNSGLTGHLTIDLQEFVGEDDSEIYLEYPLSASNSRHRTAKLQVVVQCKGPPEHDDDDCFDMDLETFLYDEFPESLLKSSQNESEVEPLPNPASSVGENNLDAPDQQQGCGPLSHVGLDGLQPKFGENNQEALGQQQGDGVQFRAISLVGLDGLQPKFGDNNQEVLGQQQCDGVQSQIPSLKDFEDDFLGLDSILKDFVTEYAETRPLLGGQRKKPKDQNYPIQRDLHAAVFFAAGFTMQQRLQSVESNSQSPLLRTQDSADRGISSTLGASRVLLRSQSDEFDVKRILSGPESPLPEVLTISQETGHSGLKLSDGPFSAPVSPCPDNSEIECAKGSTDIATEWEDQRGVRHIDFAAYSTCSAESKNNDALPVSENLSPCLCEDSSAMTRAEETQSLIPVSSSKPSRSAVVVVRNILGILFIAGVSFVLGAHAGLLGGACDTDTDGASKWSEIQQRDQMGAWKESLISQMPKVNSEIGGLQRGRSPEHHTTSRPSIVADKIGHPEQVRLGHRKIALPSPARIPAVEVFQDENPKELRGTKWKEGTHLSNLQAAYRRNSKGVATIEQQASIGTADSLYRRRNAIA